MVKLNKIYTRTGDDGTTGLADGSRVEKHSLRVKAYGDVDEANSVIGVLRASISGDNDMLRVVQNDLFDLGADLATPLSADGMALRIVPSQVTRLEKEIDALNEMLEPLNSFILPGGSAAAAHAHVARTVVRRAERYAYELADVQEVNEYALHYLNRLSDYLFVLARTLNNAGKDDVLWVPGDSR